LSQSLQRFLDRRGQGLFALMLEAPDPDAEADVLAGRGLKVLPLMAGAGGRDVHPASTHGVLIRVYPVDSYRCDPASVTPSALSGVRRVIIAVKDLDAAAGVYGARLGMPADPPVNDTARGVASVLVRPPTGGVIELVAVRNPRQPFAAAIAAHLDAHSEGMYALVMQASAPLLDTLRARGLNVNTAADSPRVLEIARDAAFGALIRIEDTQPTR
jgi:hypothetical protein